MPNKITFTFVGDADSLTKAAKQGDTALAQLGDTADKSGKQLKVSASWTDALGTRMGHLGSAVSGASDAFDAVGGSLQAVVDLQQAGARRASALAHAVSDLEQAQEDYNQALRDGAQSQLDADQALIDLEQANLDASVAQKEYNAAVKEYGENSDEAHQATLDLWQANQDAAQAQEDANQATRDGAQAAIDAKGAQLDLADAQREANPPEMQKWADQLTMVTPLLSAVAGVVGLVTAAQWLWNAAQLASPTTWIIIGITVLIGIIVLIATKTTWFQDLWKAAWGGIKKAAAAVWDWLSGVPDALGKTFSKVADAISAPFRAAFNFISKAWNNTIGKLSWTVPGWIPGIGGATISAPRLPTFHQGGVVPGVPGQEVLALLQAGEKVTPAGGGGSQTINISTGVSGLDRLLLQYLLELLRANNLVLVKR